MSLSLSLSLSWNSWLEVVDSNPWIQIQLGASSSTSQLFSTLSQLKTQTTSGKNLVSTTTWMPQLAIPKITPSPFKSALDVLQTIMMMPLHHHLSTTTEPRWTYSPTRIVPKMMTTTTTRLMLLPLSPTMIIIPPLHPRWNSN